jgi:hypothetical protein
MGDFWMELKAVNRSRPVGDGGVRAGRGRSQRDEILAEVAHLIAMAHPDIDLVGKAGE